ncbi:50S ribosomal protein L13 [Candidatus Peregrinibacteria bacterium]|nr:50S ribosomal protein L13 [Candidatus Peregrinibacteria bacterium]
MKTFSAKKTDIKPHWYLVDAEGKIPGRIGTKIADILRGKHKAIFTPHVDCGDYVIIVNAEKIYFTGKKLEKKKYYTHSGYMGHLREITAGKMKDEKPEKLLKNIIAGMIPRNRLKKDILEKLKIYAGPEHPHTAQNPETLTL